MPDLEPAAPAQPEVSAPVLTVDTAVDQAVADKDYAAFKDARHVERGGQKPVVAKAVETKTEPLQTEPPQSREVSKRQHQINTYERELALLRAENARLKTPPVTAPAPAAKVEAPAPPEFDSWDQWSEQHPDKSYDHYIDARARFTYAQLRETERQEERRQVSARAHEAKTQALVARVTKYQETDPGFLDRLDGQMLDALRPSAALAPGEKASALTAIADRLLDTDVAPQMLQHFSDHPEDLRALTQLSPAELFLRLGRLEAALDSQGGAAPAKTPIPVTRMPAPTTDRKSVV